MAGNEIDVELGMLQQRRIEAEIIKPIYDVLVRDCGLEKARCNPPLFNPI